jgi:hypothetical protein
MKTWYLNRLRTMSGPEFFFRARQFLQKKYEQYFLKKDLPGKIPYLYEKKILFADLVSKGIFPSIINVFGKKIDYFSEEIKWHMDVFSNNYFPIVFSKNINIRLNEDLSAKNVWEINRLQFLVHLAFNYTNTGNEFYLNKSIEIISSWIDNNPYLMGINWYSNIEVNIRLITWAICWEILDIERLIRENPDYKDFVETRWIPSIYQHCKYSYLNPSKYSSANNHLVSEYAGLFIANSKWKFGESEKWLRYSKQGLEREICQQHSTGINKEEAAEYIQFITDFFLLSFVIGARTNNSFSSGFEKQLKEIIYYIYNFLDRDGNYPKYGDEDDGKCFIIDPDDQFNNFRSLLTSGSILFHDPKLKSKSNGFDVKNKLLFGDEGLKIFESVQVNDDKENSQFYRKEGHFIFRKQEDQKEIYLHFNAAPLGYLSIAAHGHADALSFIMHIDGHPVFIDSGTYTYHTHPEWRKYFIGTLAHNTISINKKDQALNGGPTLWLEHYEIKILDSKLDDNLESIKATHNGYANEKSEHIREILFEKSKNEFHIIDTIVVKDKNEKIVELPFHLHPDVLIHQNSSDRYATGNTQFRQVELTIDEKLDHSLIKGQIAPQILGWYSGSFMNKEATNSIYCNTVIDKTTIFKNVIKIN